MKGIILAEITCNADGIYVKWLHSGLTTIAASLECHSCENFWSKRDFDEFLRKDYAAGYMAMDLTVPVGFLAYEYDRDNECVVLVNMVVATSHRRKRVGTDMLSHLMKILVHRPHWSIVTNVRESNLGAQLFLKANGFLADGVEKAYFIDEYEEDQEVEDAYRFVYSITRER